MNKCTCAVKLVRARSARGALGRRAMARRESCYLSCALFFFPRVMKSMCSARPFPLARPPVRRPSRAIDDLCAMPKHACWVDVRRRTMNRVPHRARVFSPVTENMLFAALFLARPSSSSAAAVATSTAAARDRRRRPSTRARCAKVRARSKCVGARAVIRVSCRARVTRKNASPPMNLYSPLVRRRRARSMARVRCSNVRARSRCVGAPQIARFILLFSRSAWCAFTSSPSRRRLYHRLPPRPPAARRRKEHTYMLFVYEDRASARGGRAKRAPRGGRRAKRDAGGERSETQAASEARRTWRRAKRDAVQVVTLHAPPSASTGPHSRALVPNTR